MQVSREQIALLVRYRDDARTAVRQTLYRQCSGESVCHEDIEDLSSDTIQDALVWLQKQEPRSSIDEAHLRNSVRLIAKRRALNWYYRRHRRNELFDEFRGIIQDHLHQNQDTRETLKRLDDVFDFAGQALDADEIQLIRLKYMQGKDHNAIAAELGINATTSRARLSRAIKKLHARLTEPLEDSPRQPTSPSLGSVEADGSIHRSITAELPEDDADETLDEAPVVERFLRYSIVTEAPSEDPTRSVERATGRIDPPPAMASDEGVLECLLELFGELSRGSG
jgi:RNA polymerase sigma factor (sigma-70 family)